MANPTYVNAIQIPATPTSDHEGCGLIVPMTYGESLVPGNIVYLKSDGKVWKADANAAGAYPAIGIALETLGANASGKVLLFGLFLDASFAWTVGGTVYLSTTAGAMTQTAPSATDEVIQVLGVAVSATLLMFNPVLSYITHT